MSDVQEAGVEAMSNPFYNHIVQQLEDKLEELRRAVYDVKRRERMGYNELTDASRAADALSNLFIDLRDAPR